VLTGVPAAAAELCLQIAAYPPLAPLVLVLKVYLRSCGLNEVANGGISSFSLTNMVLAHIMDELRVSWGVILDVNSRTWA
jgi:non-canonical poly(A) RNA polymerase PAPD5/7